MSWWQAILLGIIQGLTEFLPVSSSGHLLIFKEILHVDTANFLDFTVTVHLATVLSTILVFREQIFSLALSFLQFKKDEESSYVCKLLVSAIPVAIIGLFFKKYVDEVFSSNLHVVAYGLIATAVILAISSYIQKLNRASRYSPIASRIEITYKQAFIVGLAQAFAVLPGVSRSGSTIAVGQIIGIDKAKIAQFSFLMVLIPIIGEQSLDLLKHFHSASAVSTASLPFSSLALAFLAAFISGLFACTTMLRIVKAAKLGYFSIYCLLVAILIFIFV